MFVALLAFFSRISDPRLGGTYITFLNTVANLGMSWTSTVALGVIDLLTLKKCSIDSNNYCTTIDQENVRILFITYLYCYIYTHKLRITLVPCILLTFIVLYKCVASHI